MSEKQENENESESENLESFLMQEGEYSVIPQERFEVSGLIFDITTFAQDEVFASKEFEMSVNNSHSNVCILDNDGVIIYTNTAWRCFSSDNGAEASNTGIGMNYLKICEFAASSATCPIERTNATAFYEGLCRLLRGDTREEFSLVYPCDSPQEKRWFMARAFTFTIGDVKRTIVSHQNITDCDDEDDCKKACNSNNNDNNNVRNGSNNVNNSHNNSNDNESNNILNNNNDNNIDGNIILRNNDNNNEVNFKSNNSNCSVQRIEKVGEKRGVELTSCDLPNKVVKLDENGDKDEQNANKYSINDCEDNPCVPKENYALICEKIESNHKLQNLENGDSDETKSSKDE